MRHTVIGLFGTYAQAQSARDTLVQTGFAYDAIELQANPVPSATGATDAVENAGVLANIERFISSLFAKEPRAPEAARYTDAVRCWSASMPPANRTRNWPVAPSLGWAPPTSASACRAGKPNETNGTNRPPAANTRSSTNSA